MSTHKKARTVDAVASFQKNKTAALFYYTGKLLALVFSEGVFYAFILIMLRLQAVEMMQ